MAKLQAKVRHIILMTDGIAPQGAYDALTAQMRQDNITLSTIAIGTDADFGLLHRLADQANGRYYESLDPFDVPQIALKETMEVARAAIVEKPVSPVASGSSSITDGLDVSQLPQLGGYVATTAKPSSTVVLSSPDDDPLLAEWQYGLGEVVAWTSDAESRWSANWVSWPQFAQFWTQLVKRTVPSQLDRNLQITAQQVGTQVHLVVDSQGNDGGYLNLLQSEATVVDPQNDQQTITLKQTAPGRYEGSSPLSQEGAYAIGVSQRAGDGSLVAQQTTGFVLPYSAEYRDLGGNESLLQTLAEQTKGKQLSQPADAFLAPAAANSGREVWPFLVGLAALLFLVDIGARRLRVGLRDLRHGWRQLGEWWRRRGQPVAQPAAQRLLLAKRRLQAEAPLTRRAAANRISAVVTPRTPAGAAGAADTAHTGPTSAALGTRLMAAKKRAAKEK
jgi:Ca-activated chloride channel homolog